MDNKTDTHIVCFPDPGSNNQPSGVGVEKLAAWVSGEKDPEDWHLRSSQTLALMSNSSIVHPIFTCMVAIKAKWDKPKYTRLTLLELEWGTNVINQNTILSRLTLSPLVHLACMFYRERNWPFRAKIKVFHITCHLKIFNLSCETWGRKVCSPVRPQSSLLTRIPVIFPRIASVANIH